LQGFAQDGEKTPPIIVDGLAKLMEIEWKFQKGVEILMGGIGAYIIFE
jgi:hypothetical protein